MRALLMIAWLGVALPVAAVDPGPCLECHQGASSQGLAPALEGQHSEYLEIQLTRFREHIRPSFPMNDLARGLDDEVIRALATELASRPWSGYPGRVEPTVAERGAALVRQRDCTACHGPALLGAGSIPRLAGQSAEYLRQQLDAFSGGDRYHPPTGGGQRMQALAPGDSLALAQWLASLNGEAVVR